ncbi:MAG: hypothetical protein HUU10_07300 [Bacteroidetes bacterium]|nr:hypothetical protein [Bacteroidota bacterium]
MFSSRNKRLLITTLLLAGMTGCASDSPRQTEGVTPDSTGNAMILVLGSGGGFAGTWTGQAVNRQGDVFSWTGPYPDSVVYSLAYRLAPETFRHVDSLLNLPVPPVHQPGNFSFYLQIRQQPAMIWNPATPGDTLWTSWYESYTTLIDNNQQGLR